MFWDGKHRLHFCIFHAFFTIYDNFFNHILVNIFTYLHVKDIAFPFPMLFILCVLFYQLILQVFNGNSGRNDIVKHSLKEYASARFIRFQPENYSGHKALRVEVFGVLVSTGINLYWWSNIAGTDPGFFKGMRRRQLQSWGCRTNGTCPQNVAICEMEYILSMVNWLIEQKSYH